ncbi:MAG: hypothetical protein Q8O53_03310, partial [Candidatus Moranbacteria bacterium]|nr:hypothetical protein [Candidatus Moranbacteria bacterium]
MDINTDNKPLYYPMLVSENGTVETIGKQIEDNIWKHFHMLPKEKRDILIADELPLKIKELQDSFHLADAVIGKISLSIRQIFFGEFGLPECEAKIGSLLTATGSDSIQAKAIVEFIQKEILTIQPKPRVEKEEVEEEKRPPAALVRMPLLQALSKYESLGNQLITRERIKVKSQAEPVRPSLLYWIKYYRDELGIGHHDSVQRGNFLFRSENGKHLSAEERERVNLVLKSVEENLPLQIDTERSEIVFPIFETPRPIAPPRPAMPEPPLAPQKTEPHEVSEAFSFGSMSFNNNTEPVPADPAAMSFSSKHVFPAEKEETSSTPMSAPVASVSTTRPMP